MDMDLHRKVDEKWRAASKSSHPVKVIRVSRSLLGWPLAGRAYPLRTRWDLRADLELRPAFCPEETLPAPDRWPFATGPPCNLRWPTADNLHCTPLIRRSSTTSPHLAVPVLTLRYPGARSWARPPEAPSAPRSLSRQASPIARRSASLYAIRAPHSPPVAFRTVALHPASAGTESPLSCRSALRWSWRTRSRVTPSSAPTSARVAGSRSSSP